MTFIFNVFVILQIFNLINCRKIEEELNVFQNILNSSWFIGIVALILGL
jgi:hypothetical protein